MSRGRSNRNSWSRKLIGTALVIVVVLVAGLVFATRNLKQAVKSGTVISGPAGAPRVEQSGGGH